MISRVTDFRTAVIEMTQSQFHSLPKPVQEYLNTYATEYPQGWGKPVVLELAIYHVERLEQLCRECGMEAIK